MPVTQDNDASLASGVNGLRRIRRAPPAAINGPAFDGVDVGTALVDGGEAKPHDRIDWRCRSGTTAGGGDVPVRSSRFNAAKEVPGDPREQGLGRPAVWRGEAGSAADQPLVHDGG